MIKVNCKHCGRYQFTATSNTIIEEVPCKCGAKNNFKILFMGSANEQDLNYKFKHEEIKPKKETK